MEVKNYKNQEEFYLKIADFNIKIQAKDKKKLTLDLGYYHYLVNSVENVDFTVDITTQELENEYINQNAIFDSRNDEKRFFTTYLHENQYTCFIFDQETQKSQQIVRWHAHQPKLWQVEVAPDADGQSFPLRYPLGPLMMYQLTMIYPAVMIHSSGADDAGFGRLFTGFSGVGKSTISGIWKDSGANLINDDRLIIRKTDTGYQAHNTPMFYVDKPKQMQLKAIYVIRHAPENELVRLKPALAVSHIFAHCIQHSYNAKFIEQHLSFISEMCSTLPVASLGFVPTPEVIDFVRNAD